LTDKQLELVEFSYYGNSTDSTLFAYLSYLRYSF
jgi:hypothetical protein